MNKNKILPNFTNTFGIIRNENIVTLLHVCPHTMKNFHIRFLKKQHFFTPIHKEIVTSKNVCVDPPRTTPYLISVCRARSSTLSMGVTIRSTVRKAAIKIPF